jgi:hypothetical protein
VNISHIADHVSALSFTRRISGAWQRIAAPEDKIRDTARPAIAVSSSRG